MKRIFDSIKKPIIVIGLLLGSTNALSDGYAYPVACTASFPGGQKIVKVLDNISMAHMAAFRACEQEASSAGKDPSTCDVSCVPCESNSLPGCSGTF